MINTQKHWFNLVPWEKVLATHAEFCQAQEVGTEQAASFAAVQTLWNEAAGRACSLREALDLCRDARERAPFVFNNGNTFAAIAKCFVEDWAKSLPSADGQILRNTVAHYVAGRIEVKELTQVLQYFGQKLITPAEAPVLAPLPAKPSVQSSGAA